MKKYYWSILTIMMVTVLFMSSAACSSSDDDNDSPAFKKSLLYNGDIGKRAWTLTTINCYKGGEIVKTYSKSETWTFYKDGTFTNNSSFQATWELSGNQLSILFPTYYSGLKNEKKIYTIVSISDSQLVLSSVYEDDEYDTQEYILK